MQPEDLLKQAQEIEKEIKEEEAGQKDYKKPLIWIIALFLALIIILMVVPHYAVRLDPFPKQIPEIEDVVPADIVFDETKVSNREDYNTLIQPNDHVIKTAADKIVRTACKNTDSRVCYAKAIYYFVRDKFDYVNDPLAFEYVKSAKESLVTQNGDCEDASVLAANLLQAIGINTRFVFIPQHVFIQILLPEALDKYKQEDGWTNLDLTCNNCEFGDVPYNNLDKQRVYS